MHRNKIEAQRELITWVSDAAKKLLAHGDDVTAARLMYELGAFLLADFGEIVPDDVPF